MSTARFPSGDGLSGLPLVLHKVLLKNELGGVSAYALSHAGARSGYSFGLVQWDLANGADSGVTLFERIVRNATDASGRGIVPNEARDRILKNAVVAGNPNALSVDDRKLANAALSSVYGRAAIDAAHPRALEDRLRHVDSIIGTIADPTDRAFLSSDAMRIWLADFHNQFNLTTNGEMHRFLRGERVRIGLDDRNEIQVVGQVDLGDVLGFYFKTLQAEKSAASAGDLARRFNNINEVLQAHGIAWPTAVDETVTVPPVRSSSLDGSLYQVESAQDGITKTAYLVTPGTTTEPGTVHAYLTDGSAMPTFAVAGPSGALALALPAAAVQGVRSGPDGIEIVMAVAQSGHSSHVLRVDRSGHATLETDGQAVAAFAPGTRLSEWFPTADGWKLEGVGSQGEPLRVTWRQDESAGGTLTVDTITEGTTFTRTIAVGPEGVSVAEVTSQDRLAGLVDFIEMGVAAPSDVATDASERAARLAGLEERMREERAVLSTFEREMGHVTLAWEGSFDGDAATPGSTTDPAEGAWWMSATPLAGTSTGAVYYDPVFDPQASSTAWVNTLRDEFDGAAFDPRLYGDFDPARYEVGDDFLPAFDGVSFDSYDSWSSIAEFTSFSSSFNVNFNYTDYVSSYQMYSYTPTVTSSYDYSFSFFDPVVLDLDGDGLDAIGLWDSDVFFDMDADGFFERTGWIAGDDGVLVHDRNANHVIDDSTELFSEKYAPGAASGMAALRTLDANADGIVDAADAAFASLEVWRDVDQDGVADIGELLSLTTLGIAGIDVATSETERIRDGNLIVARGGYLRSDGTRGDLFEAALLVSVEGFRREPLDGAGGTMERVETDAGDAYAVALDDVRHTVDLGARGLGAAVGGAGSDVFGTSATDPVMLDGGAGNDSLDGGAGADVLAGGPGADRLRGGDGHDTVSGGSGADTVDGGAGSDTVTYQASSAAVTVDLIASTATGGDAQGDTLTSIENAVGSDFADVLMGTTTGNRLSGGRGNDTLRGAAGDDTYQFNRGDGLDLIHEEHRHQAAYTVEVPTVTYVVEYTGGEYGAWTEVVRAIEGSRTETRYREEISAGGADVLAFGAGITVADVCARLVGSDLVVEVKAPGGSPVGLVADQITLKGWTQVRTRIERFSFVDGTLLQVDGIVSLLGTDSAESITWTETPVTMTAGAGDDTVSTGGGADVLSGNEGRDVLNGGAGNDSLIGGPGSDTLRGGAGNDTLFIDADDASSAIQGGSGIDAVVITAETGMTFDLGPSSIEVGFGGPGDDQLRTSVNLTVFLEGRDGNDVLIGSGRLDKLDGGYGDDTLIGRQGADSLIGGAGVDTASYEQSSAAVVVSLAAGTGSGGAAAGDRLSEIENVLGSAHGDRLTGDQFINRLVGGQGNDTLTGGGAADLIEGGDGTDTASYSSSPAGVRVSVAPFFSAVGPFYAWNGDAEGDVLRGVENITGSQFGDTLYGGAGASVLVGGDGNDILAGLGGADRLEGGSGSDTASYAMSPAAVTVSLASGAVSGGDAAGDSLTDIEDVWGSRYADHLTGTAQANVLAGFGGNDTLLGGGGPDVYRVERFDGIDLVHDEYVFQVAYSQQVAYTEEYTELVEYYGGESSSWVSETRTRTVYRTETAYRDERGDGGHDVVTFAAGIEPANIWLRRDGQDVVVGIRGAAGTTSPFENLVDGVRLRNWSTAATRVEDLRFADGTLIDLVALDGLLGSDALNVARGNGITDTRAGTTASDTFLFRRGDGADVITGRDATSTTDRVVLGAGIAPDDVWLLRRDNDLEMSLVGTTDRLTFRGWYASTAARVDEIRTSDGTALLQSRVEQLRHAMAVFDPPAGVGLELTAEVQDTLAPVIATSWERPASA